MNNRVLQDCANFVHRTILRARYLAQGALIRRLVRQSERQIKDMRRHTIRVGDVADSHPSLNPLILVVAPVNGVAHEEKSVMPGKSYEEEEGGQNQPLSPVEPF